MSDTDALGALRSMLAAAGLPELQPWQERAAAAMLDARLRRAIVSVPYHDGQRAWRDLAERASRNAESPAASVATGDPGELSGDDAG